MRPFPTISYVFGHHTRIWVDDSLNALHEKTETLFSSRADLGERNGWSDNTVLELLCDVVEGG